MKLWKKLTAVAVALTMSASAWALAGCEPENTNNNNSSTIDSDDGNNNGNGNGNGNVNETGNGNENNNGVSKVSAIISAVEGQELSTVIGNFSFSQENSFKMINKEADESYSNQVKVSGEASIKANLADGDFDVAVSGQQEFIEEYDNVKDYERIGAAYYLFVRNWDVYECINYDHTYYPEGELHSEISDWSGVPLYYAGNLRNSGADIAGNVWTAMDFDRLISYEPKVNAKLLSLAAEAEAVSVESNKAVVDINKIADKALSDLSAALNGFTEKTTASAILKNATISKYLSTIIDALSAEELEILLTEYFASYEFEEIIDYIFENIEPDANSGTYAYLIKIVESAELLAKVSDMFDDLFDLPKGGLGEITIGFFLDMVYGGYENEDGVSYLDYAKDYVAALSKTVTETIETLKIEYTLNSDNTIASLKVTADIAEEYSDGDEYIQIESFRGMSFEGIIEYTSEKATFTDISDCVIEGYYYYAIPDDKLYRQ